jgi:HD superfamily phosphodiesterase
MKMKNKLLAAMEAYFGPDQKRIDHARRVLRRAEQILEREAGDRQIVEAAAVLHDIGIHAAEKKYGSAAGRYQEIEGPPIADNILQKIKFPAEKIPAVLKIITHHHSPGKVDSNEFKILCDADWLINLGDEHDLADKHRLKRMIDKIFMTRTGKELARQTYLA